jgi:hypothetical protein
MFFILQLINQNFVRTLSLCHACYTCSVHVIWFDLIIPKFIGKYELLSPQYVIFSNPLLLYASSQTPLAYEDIAPCNPYCLQL